MFILFYLCLAFIFYSFSSYQRLLLSHTEVNQYLSFQFNSLLQRRRILIRWLQCRLLGQYRKSNCQSSVECWRVQRMIVGSKLARILALIRLCSRLHLQLCNSWCVLRLPCCLRVDCRFWIMVAILLHRLRCDDSFLRSSSNWL